MRFPRRWRSRLAILAVISALARPSAAGSGDGSKDEKTRQPPALRVERVTTTFVFQNDGTARMTTDLRYRVLTDIGRQGAGQAFVLYSSRSEEASIENLRTINADGTTLEADGVSMEVTPPPTAMAPQFSDLQAKVLLARSVDVGDAVEYRMVRAIVHPLKPGDFWSDYERLEGVPCDSEDVVLDVPADRAVLVRWPADRVPKQETKDGRKVYRWTLGTSEPDPDDWRPKAPVFVASTMTADQLAAWYVGLQADRSEVTPEIRGKVEALTAGMTAPRQKLEALYTFVASSVRYVSVSFGIGGYQPHRPAEVLQNLFGDCKDKDILLRTMLSAAGIAAQPAVLNAALGIPQPEVGAPSQFNHVMTVATLDGEAIWLDTTTGMMPFGVLEPSIRGRKALLASASAGRVVQITERSPVADRGTAEMKGKLDAGGGLTLDTRIRATGLTEATSRLMLRVSSAAGGRPGQIWGSLTTGFSGKVDTFDASEAAALATPLRVDYTSTATWIGPEKMKAQHELPSILLRLRAGQLNPRRDPKYPSDDPVSLGDPGEVRETVTIELDPSFEASLPTPIKVERPFAAYESAYVLAGHTVTATRTLTFRRPQVPATQADEVRAFQKLVEADLEQDLILRRSAKPDLRKLATTLDADALDAAGSNALDNGDYELGRDLCTAATEKDPKHKTAWDNLGRAQLALLDIDGAERSFNKQLEIDPKDAYAHSNLGRVFWLRGKLSDAEKQFRKQLEINPLDAYATSCLGHLLAALGRWSEAADVLSRAVQLQSGNDKDKPALIAALTKSGRSDDARARAAELFDADPSIDERLAVASVFVEENLDVDRADAEANKAMSEAASKCRGVSLEAVPEDYWRSVAELVAGYEVRGGAAVRKGDVDRAIPLLRTAYDIAPQATTALWLSRAYAKKGDGATAFRYFAIAKGLAWRGQTIEPPAELKAYLDATFKSDAAAQSAKMDELAKERLTVDRVSPAHDGFTLPDKYPGDAGVTFKIKVLVDENGDCHDAKALGGEEPFLGAALKDVRRMKFRPLGLPSAPIKSIRVVEFFYLPTKEVRAFSRFEPEDANELRIERVLPLFGGAPNTP